MSLAQFPALLVAAIFTLSAPATAAPDRVVSMNVCTDQMAMLVAADGQLVSVSHLTTDPNTSVMTGMATKYRPNHGLAEEIFLLRPDLVIAGTYTTRATVDLLRRLGIRVEEFAPENSFDDVRASLRRLGGMLDRERRAEELITDLDRRLAELAAVKRPDISVAAWYANSYTSGAGTLVDAVIVAAGLENMAAKLGLAGTANLPLELLVLARPDLLAAGSGDYSAPALAEQNFVHPAYRALAQSAAAVSIPPAYTICGTPFSVEAARLLQDAARALPGRPKP